MGNVMRPRFVRWLVSPMLVLALAATSAVSVQGFLQPSCETARHECAKAVLTDRCCQQPAAATTALSVFAESWSSVVKLYWVSASWIADTVSPGQPAEIAFALDFASVRSSTGVPPTAPTADSLTALLI